MERPKCEIEDCDNFTEARKYKSGFSTYRKICQTHRKKKKDGKGKCTRGGRRRVWFRECSQLPCSQCGWNKSYCDRHRIIPGSEGGKYIKENVIPLCPNCHREEHHPNQIKYEPFIFCG